MGLSGNMTVGIKNTLFIPYIKYSWAYNFRFLYTFWSLSNSNASYALTKVI